MTKKFDGLTFGVPKEIMQGERRVAVTPEIVRRITEAGGEVLVESGAGLGSFFSDDTYKKAGAKVIKDIKNLYDDSNIILKVKEPLFHKALNKHEVDLMHEDQVLVTFLHPAAPANHDMVKKLIEKKVTSLTLDGIPRISRAQAMDALTSMSTVAGYKSVLMSANRLPKFIPMTATAVGAINPANIVVLGIGVAGLQALAMAKRLGGIVYAIDIRPEAVEHAKSLGAKVIDTKVPEELAVGKGGYAQHLPKEWLEKEREVIKDTIIDADIVIATALVPGKLAPVLITRDMVKEMEPGSVIVDVAIDQGGNCELTEGGKTTEVYDVTIIGTKNIPGMVPKTSTWMFANNVYYYIENLIKDGEIIINMEDEIIASSLVTKDGKLVHEGAKEAMGLK